MDEIGRSLERRRVIQEDEEIRYPITTNVFRTLNAARRGVGAGVNTLLGDAPQRFRRKARNVVVDSSRKIAGALTDAGDDVAWALLAPPSPGLEEAVEGEGRQWAGLD